MSADREVPGLVRLARMPVDARHDLLDSASVTLASTSDPLTAINLLRREHPQWDADLCSAVLTQYELRVLGARRGLLAPGSQILATPVGLEQASRPEVAARRARMLISTGVRSVIDASAGIGIDACAFAEAGLDVIAIDNDPTTAEVCAANLARVTDSAQVVTADATQPGLLESIGTGRSAASRLSGPIAVFVDPARRSGARPVDGSRAHPERDPERWSPPWSFVESLRDRFEVVAAKAPGSFTPGAGWSCEWLGVADYTAECSLFSSTPDAFVAARQATLLPEASNSDPLTYPARDSSAPVGPVGDYLGEPHPALHRCLPALCQLGCHLVHERSTWLSTDLLTVTQATPGVRWYRVIDTAPIKDMNRCATANGVDAVAIKCKESRTPLSTLRKKIALPDGDRYAIVLTPGSTDAHLVERLDQ